MKCLDQPLTVESAQNRSCYYYDFYIPLLTTGHQIPYQGAITELVQIPSSLSRRGYENEASGMVVGGWVGEEWSFLTAVPVNFQLTSGSGMSL